MQFSFILENLKELSADICKYKALKPATERLAWNYDKNLFIKWCDGATGFPLVDAAMRQLNQTGWMHNRANTISQTVAKNNQAFSHILPLT